MVETRPKRSAAMRAESENKRIALAARKPMEAQDLQTQEDYERERPTPRRRASVQHEVSPMESPDCHQASTRAARGMMSQIQVVIPQASPVHFQRRTTPLHSHSRSQSVPAISSSQQFSPQPATPTSRPQAQKTPSTRNSQRPLPPSSSSHGPDFQRQTPDAAIKSFIPTEGQQNSSVAPAQLPKPLDQVINSNREIRQHASAQVANVASFLGLAHPQPQNTIHQGFEKASPANRASTKSAEEMMASQTPPIDADTAQVLRRQMSKEDMIRLGLTNINPAQRLQQAYYAQRTGTSQLALGQQTLQSRQARPAGMPQSSPGQQQYASHEPLQPKNYSSPPEQPTGLTNVSVNALNQQDDSYNGPMYPSRASPGPLGDSTLPTPTAVSGISAVPVPRSSKQGASFDNSVISIINTHPRASSETPIGSHPARNRSRAHSADSKLLGPPNFVKSGPGASPGLLVTNSNVNRPQVKLNFDRNAHSRGQISGCLTEDREDSDATVSPSPRKIPGRNRDSDAAISPSPVENTGPGNVRVLPPVPLFHQEEELAEGPVRPRAPSHTRVLNQAQSRAHLSEAGVPTNRQVQVPVALSDNEPMDRQRNLDFQYRSVSDGVEPVKLRQQQEEHSARFDREMDEMNTQQSMGPRRALDTLGHEQQQNLRERHPCIDNIESRFQVRNYALATAADLTTEENEELRLSSAFAKMLGNLRLARAADKDKVQEEEQNARQSSKSFVGCLAVTQLAPALDVSDLSHSPAFHEVMIEDDDVCVFCNYETCFGIADSRVWLPPEASPGYCNECHEDTQQVFRMWEGPYRLPHGLSQEDKEKFKSLIEISTATPLKELGDAADFKSQQKLEMSKPRRKNAILNASKPCTKDGREDRRAQRKEYNQIDSVRNIAKVPRGGKLPQRRAVSGGSTRQNSTATDVQRVVSDGIRGNQHMGNSTRNVTHFPSRMSSHTTAILHSNPHQAAQTAWVHGVPSSLPLRSGAVAPGHPTVRSRSDGRVITPGSATLVTILDLAAPPGSMTNSLTSTSATGTLVSSSLATSNANIPGQPDATTSAQPTGDRSPSGVPIYFNTGPPGSFLSPPPFSSGPIFCRGCPWRQIDFTKAKICPACRDCKFMICSHVHQRHFSFLAEIEGVMNGEHEGHGLGRYTGSEHIITDGRYSNCMVCPGQATHGCNDCPLRLCAECVVRLTKLCKGKMNELLNFYNNGRDHIRNDAFLLRNDNKGF